MKLKLRLGVFYTNRPQKIDVAYSAAPRSRNGHFPTGVCKNAQRAISVKANLVTYWLWLRGQPDQGQGQG